jgi:CheY-like chemotaxis protein
MKTSKEVVILIAEDDDGHAELIIDGFRELGLANEIIRFEDGQEIWNFLMSKHIEQRESERKNYLILLDINMPRMDGVEVLRRIKLSPGLQDMLVMMLTTTDDPREIERCYQYGCNVYITKPIDFMSFTDTLKRLGLFLQIIKL